MRIRTFVEVLPVIKSIGSSVPVPFANDAIKALPSEVETPILHRLGLLSAV